VGVREGAFPEGLLQRYATDLHDVALPPYDDFARYCIKMATGSGKTKVMSLAVAWQFLNAVREADEIAEGLCQDIPPHRAQRYRAGTAQAGLRRWTYLPSDPVIPTRTRDLLGLRLRDAGRAG
jgi:hypothetical protein